MNFMGSLNIQPTFPISIHVNAPINGEDAPYDCYGQARKFLAIRLLLAVVSLRLRIGVSKDYDLGRYVR